MPPNQTRVRAVFLPAIFMLALGFAAAILPARADSSANSRPAESYIADFFRTTVETAVSPRSEEYATKAVNERLVRDLPLDETAHFMLGRAWPTDNQEAGRQFQQQFRDFVAETLTRSLRANPSIALEVKGSRPRPDGSILVLSDLNLPSGNAVPIEWQVVENPVNGTFQIADVAVLGIHAAIMLRTICETMLGDGQTQVGDIIPRLRAALNRRAGTAAASPVVTSP